MDEISELSEDAKNILRAHIYQQKEYEYRRGVLTGMMFGTVLCASMFLIYKL